MTQIAILSVITCNFFLLIVFQLIIRKFIDWSEDKSLLLIWGFFPFLIIVVELYIGGIDFYTIAFLTYLTAAAWVVSFPAIYAASPTLVIMLLIEQGFNDNDSLKKIAYIKDNSDQRIDDAFKFGFIKRNGDVVTLTRFGNLFFKFIYLFKLIHGIDKVEAL